MKFNSLKKAVLASSILAISSVSQAAVTELVTNGGFETGDFSGWTQAIAGTQAISGVNPSSGSFSANMSNPNPSANLLQQFNLGAGLLSAGQSVTFSFDYRGTAEAGGVLFAELFSIDGFGGVTKSELLSGGPFFPVPGDADAWQTFMITTTLGPDVTNGVTLQINAACGAAAGCVSDYFVDNISLTADVAAVPVPAAAWLFGSSLIALVGTRRKRQSN